MIYHIFGGRTRSQAREGPSVHAQFIRRFRRLRLTATSHRLAASLAAPQVWCHQCGSVSNSYESFLTLSLEVTGRITRRGVASSTSRHRSPL